MPKYHFTYQHSVNGDIKAGNWSKGLGIIEHSELQEGNVVTLPEEWQERIQSHFPEVNSFQFWVGCVIHHIGSNEATVFIVHERGAISNPYGQVEPAPTAVRGGGVSWQGARENLQLTDEMISVIDEVDNAAEELINKLLVYPSEVNGQLVNDVVETVGQLLRNRGVEIYYPLIEQDESGRLNHSSL